MANTFPKKTLRVRSPGDCEMSYWIRKLPETASETFIASSPIVITTGLVAVAADIVTALFGFALRAGRNGSADRDYFSEVVVAFPGLELFANFLAADGTGNQAIAAAQLMNANPYDLEKNAVGPGATDIWTVVNASAQDICNMVGWDTDYILPNVVKNTYAAVGDLNARVTFQVAAAKNTYIGLSG